MGNCNYTLSAHVLRAYVSFHSNLNKLGPLFIFCFTIAFCHTANIFVIIAFKSYTQIHTQRKREKVVCWLTKFNSFTNLEITNCYFIVVFFQLDWTSFKKCLHLQIGFICNFAAKYELSSNYNYRTYGLTNYPICLHIIMSNMLIAISVSRSAWVVQSLESERHGKYPTSADIT